MRQRSNEALPGADTPRSGAVESFAAGGSLAFVIPHWRRRRRAERPNMLRILAPGWDVAAELNRIGRHDLTRTLVRLLVSVSAVWFARERAGGGQ
jgi:hypothetical protein